MIASKIVKASPRHRKLITLGNDFESSPPLQFLLADIAQICYFHLQIRLVTA